MKKLAILLLVMPITCYAAELVLGLPSGNDNPGWGNDQKALNINASGQITQTLQAGEDQTNSTQKVEQQFSYCLDDADIVCKASPGFVHSISCWGEDAAATAGRVQLRDATAAGAGTVVWGQEFAAAIASPSSVILDIVMTTGIVIDWDTTADVMCTVSYR
jgi:hypothetical protein